MIDVHHHLLYGLDDGPDSIETSVAMARMAHEDGITHVVCTPHASNRYPFQPDEITSRLDRLRAELAAVEVNLTLGQGCDFHMTWENIQDAKANPQKYSINGKRYLLIELSDQVIPVGISECFVELQLAGMTPILTHPERNPAIQRNPDRIKPWLANGLLVQVTAGALIGRFGNTARNLAHRLMEDRWVHIIATDAHDIKSRPPRMREAYDLIAATWGEDTANRLCIANPRSVFDGTKLDPQPDPVGIDEDEGENRHSQSWLRRFFSRA